jgi:hypothetical protein
MQEMTAIHKGHALAKYMPELGDAIHDDEVNLGVLRKRRGTLTEEECITRITDLLSYGVGERKSCRVVGAIWREWNEWKRANCHHHPRESVPIYRKRSDLQIARSMRQQGDNAEHDEPD